jgi:hypothetical protein
MQEFPFKQIIEKNKIIRTFSPSVDSEELKWHQDEKNRVVKIIEDGGWSFQLEDSLPNKLTKSQTLEIPKFVWHRVIKGTEKLVVEIEELE